MYGTTPQITYSLSIVKEKRTLVLCVIRNTSNKQLSKQFLLELYQRDN